MNIKKRTCANCVSFYPDDGATTPECWNAVSFIDRPGTPEALARAPRPDDLCDSHQTHAEDAADDHALAKFWGRIGVSSEDRPSTGEFDNPED